MSRSEEFGKGMGEHTRSIQQMREADTGYGAGWHEDELTEPHTFRLTHVPVSSLHSLLHGDQVDNPDDGYNSKSLRDAVKSGRSGEVTLTHNDRGGFTTLDGSHRIAIAQDHGGPRTMPAWIHEGKLKP